MRLIDADYLLDRINSYWLRFLNEHGDWKVSELRMFSKMLDDTKKIVDNAETLNSVNKGRWDGPLTHVDDADYVYICSRCYNHSIFWDNRTSDYCPHCGAKMDGEAE